MQCTFLGWRCAGRCLGVGRLEAGGWHGAEKDNLQRDVPCVAPRVLHRRRVGFVLGTGIFYKGTFSSGTFFDNDYQALPSIP